MLDATTPAPVWATATTNYDNSQVRFDARPALDTLDTQRPHGLWELLTETDGGDVTNALVFHELSLAQTGVPELLTAADQPDRWVTVAFESLTRLAYYLQVERGIDITISPDFEILEALEHPLARRLIEHFQLLTEPVRNKLQVSDLLSTDRWAVYEWHADNKLLGFCASVDGVQYSLASNFTDSTIGLRGFRIFDLHAPWETCELQLRDVAVTFDVTGTTAPGPDEFYTGPSAPPVAADDTAQVVQVPYKAPVIAEVDLAERRVSSVRLLDEELELNFDGGVTLDDGLTPVSATVAARAIAIAEFNPPADSTDSNAGWPAWQRG